MQAIIWTNAIPIRLQVYVALGGDELNTCRVRYRLIVYSSPTLK